jgi:hypothetical protein
MAHAWWVKTHKKMKAQDYIDSQVWEGKLSPAEGLYLNKVATVIEANLNGEEFDKEATGAKGFLAEPLVRAVLAAGGLTALNALGHKANEYMIQPQVEQHRYKRMMSLPGARERMSVDPDTVRSLYIAEDEEDPNEAARRRAFGMLHRYAPEVTKVPELAADFLSKQMMASNPEELYTNAHMLANQAASLKKLRAEAEAKSGPNIKWDDAQKALHVAMTDPYEAGFHEGAYGALRQNGLDDGAASV